MRAVDLEDVKVVLGVFNDNAAAINNLWLLFQGVSLAFLGWVYTGKADIARRPILLVVLCLGFAIFSGGNWHAIARSQRVLFSAAEWLQGAAPLVPTVGSVLSAHEAKSPDELLWAHRGFTLAVIVGVWLPRLRSARR